MGGDFPALIYHSFTMYLYHDTRKKYHQKPLKWERQEQKRHKEHHKGSMNSKGGFGNKW